MVAKKKVKKATRKVAKKLVKKAKPRVSKKTVKKAKPAKKSTVARAKKKPVKKVVKSTAGKKKPVKKVVKKTTKKAVKKSTRQAVTVKVKKLVSKIVKKKTAKVKSIVQRPIKKAPPKKVAHKKLAPVQKNKLKSVTRAGKKVYVVIEPEIEASSAAGPLEFMTYELKKNESYMCQQQQLHFRNILLAWKRKLMDEVDSTVVHLQEDVTSYADPADRASQEEEFNLELRTRDRERKLIKKIEQALDWIEQGVYGYCEDCGADIGIRRLEARPTAAKCIDCKTFSEIREKQIGGN